MGPLGRAADGPPQILYAGAMLPAAGSAPFSRAVLGVTGAALAVRLGFVLLTPDGLVSDADFYHGYARALARGASYVNADGSPAVLWMPGWPAFLAALQLLFGPAVLVGELANALLGALTAGVVCALGSRLIQPRVGLLAGVLYALWPGVFYYAAVLFSETLFAALFWSGVLALAIASSEGQRGRTWLVGGALLVSAATWVRSEPLLMLPVLALYLWRSALLRPGGSRRGAVNALLLVSLVGLLLVPWTVRNALVFGRFIPTAANGGTVFYEGNHAGAPGSNDLPAMLEFRKRFGHLSLGEGDVARGAAGWSEGFAFIRAHPLEFLGIAALKLRATYATDDRAPVLIRGFEGSRRVMPSHHVPLLGYMSESAMLRLQLVANVYWYGVLALAAFGLAGAMSWPRETRLLLLGLWAGWLVIHVVMIGGARFHFAETPILALLAAQGITALARFFPAQEPSTSS